MSVICLILILVETNVPIPFLKSSVLNAMFSRGFLYTFLGVISLEEAVAVNYRGQQLNRGSLYIGWPALFMDITAFVIIGFGVLYMLLGLCCIGALKRKLEHDHQAQWDEYSTRSQSMRSHQHH